FSSPVPIFSWRGPRYAPHQRLRNSLFTVCLSRRQWRWAARPGVVHLQSRLLQESMVGFAQQFRNRILQWKGAAQRHRRLQRMDSLGGVSVSLPTVDHSKRERESLLASRTG